MHLRYSLTPEKSSGAATKMTQVAKAQGRKGASAKGKATVSLCVTTVFCTATFHRFQRLQVFSIVRFHRHRPANMLQCRYLIAHTVIGQS